jgi:adenylate kinase family enzyme
MHVILMGPQGSGKGTQTERVRKKLNLMSIATGELFRSAIKGAPNSAGAFKPCTIEVSWYPMT